MVPITIVAFLLAIATTDAIRIGTQFVLNNGEPASSLDPNVWDFLGLIAATVGVFLFNWYEEKPQPMST